MLQLARELAQLVPAEHPLERRKLLLLALAMLSFAQEGSTTLPLTDAGRKALQERLAALEPDASVRDGVIALLDGSIPAPLQRFVGEGPDVPLRLEPGTASQPGTLSLRRFSRLEQRLADALARQIALPPVVGAAVAGAREAFESVVKTWSFTEDQQWALLNAVHLPFSVISGGPGTGKTTIVVALLRILARLGVEPARMRLAAPTGKAANRIFEEVKGQLAKVGQHLGDSMHPKDRALLDGLPEPRTLHRLLGYSPGRDRFGADEVNPLDADLVVVDESSMVDLFLMERLFRAVGQDGKPRRLILLGDGDQLPSVEAGMILYDLARATDPLRRPWHGWTLPGGKPSQRKLVDTSPDLRARYLTTLTYSHRMNPDEPAGKAIYEYALAILAGAHETLLPGGALAREPKSAPAQLDFHAVEHLAFHAEGRQPPVAFFERWWTRNFEDRAVKVDGADTTLASLRDRVFLFEGEKPNDAEVTALCALLRAVDEQRILCLTRGLSPDGAARANEWFHRRRRGLETAAAKPSGPGGATSAASARASPAGQGFLSGEPVIFTVNDYDRKLFNGYSGVVAWVRRAGEKHPRLRAIFQQLDGPRAYELGELRGRLELAYALTVHKAQGSQVKRAALLLPPIRPAPEATGSAPSEPSVPVDDEERLSPLLVRQLVYTAVSRASESVVLVGDLGKLVEAVQRPVRRFCGVMPRTEAFLAETTAS